MADNSRFQTSTDPTQPFIADKEVTHSGDLAKVQLIQLVEVLGTEGSYTERDMTALDTLIGQLADTAAGSDTSSVSLNALIKRLLQRLTTLFAATTATAVASGTADTPVLGATTSLRLIGFSAKENAGTPAEAEFILRAGTSAAGTPLAFVKLGPNESVRDWFGPGGIDVAAGIFLDRVSGTTELVVHTRVAA